MTSVSLAVAECAEMSTADRPVAILTGAGSGLGKQLALALARCGWRLALVGRRESRLRTTRCGCMLAGLAGDDCIIVPTDITQVGAPDVIVSTAVRTFGRVDALINNAGVARFGVVSDAMTSAMVGANFLAPLALVRAATPALRDTGGSVVNVGSVGGLLALPQRAEYGATKAALHHLTRSLARELAPEVRVNAVAPGPIDTEMYETLGLSPTETAELREQLVSTTPLRRMGSPEDVVPWILLLLSDAGQWVTGAVIVVDGGRSC
jgi:NAD(P)-dependent dehydrogenase (short-subunit alcohol dehydrogenase family)